MGHQAEVPLLAAAGIAPHRKASKAKEKDNMVGFCCQSRYERIQSWRQDAAQGNTETEE